MTRPEHGQSAYRLRLDWGPAGGAAVAPGADLVVVVDVLSFTTTVTVGVERGIAVLPHPWGGAGAEAFAEQRVATLAVGRSQARASGGASLSPASLAGLSGVERLVLPSPNGASIAVALSDTGATVVAASLRNAPAVSRWLSAPFAAGAAVAVIAAGERWPDGSLRPAVEDLWGAGAVLAGLVAAHPSVTSPEAELAVHAFAGVRDTLADRLASCASGQELVTSGYPRDVEIAAELDVTGVVPVLVDGAFVDGAFPDRAFVNGAFVEVEG